MKLKFQEAYLSTPSLFWIAKRTSSQGPSLRAAHEIILAASLTHALLVCVERLHFAHWRLWHACAVTLTWTNIRAGMLLALEQALRFCFFDLGTEGKCHPRKMAILVLMYGYLHKALGQSSRLCASPCTVGVPHLGIRRGPILRTSQIAACGQSWHFLFEILKSIRHLSIWKYAFIYFKDTASGGQSGQGNKTDSQEDGSLNKTRKLQQCQDTGISRGVLTPSHGHTEQSPHDKFNIY